MPMQYRLRMIQRLIGGNLEGCAVSDCEAKGESRIHNITFPERVQCFDNLEHITDITTLLIYMLKLESSVFLTDIIESEAQLTASSNFSPPILPVASLIMSNDKPRTSTKIPVDEIILATHIAILLKTLSEFEELGGDSLLIRTDNEATSASSAAVTRDSAANILFCVTNRLPGGTWWLPSRILKAYLSLQHEVRTSALYNAICGNNLCFQTRTLVKENTLPVVAAIQSMEYNCQYNSSVFEDSWKF